MYLRQMDMIAAKLRADNLLYTDAMFLRQIIADHKRSVAYQDAMAGTRYYEDQHDILDKDFQQVTIYKERDEYADGLEHVPFNEIETVKNYNNANHHNVHNYYAQLIDQVTDYLLGIAPSVTVEGAGSLGTSGAADPLKAFENEITALTSDERFLQFLADSVVDAHGKAGVAFWHVYYDENGNLCQSLMPFSEVIPIYDTARQEKLEQVIRYYTVTELVGTAEKHLLRIEWWTYEGVAEYEEQTNGDIVLVRERGHYATWGTELGEDGVTQVPALVQMRWGRLPWVEVRANNKRTPLLNRIKSLQDAYNLLSSKLTNDEIDLVALFWVIQGYGAEAAATIRKKLELNKGVSIPDESGKVGAHQVDLNTTERMVLLNALRRDIFLVGDGLVPDVERSGNVNTVELRMRYAKLRGKATRLARELSVALSDLFWFIAEDINAKHGTDYDYRLVKTTYKFNEIIDETELIDNILKLRGMVADEDLMPLIPYVTDPNQAWANLQKQKEREANTRSQAFSGRTGGITVDGRIIQAAKSVAGEGEGED